jgi:hypothetical protein
LVLAEGRARLYSECFENKIYFFLGVKGVSVPVTVSVFPDELYPAPRSWAERAYPKLIHYTSFPRADTLRPGCSRSSSRTKYAPGSGRCAADKMEVEARGDHLRFPNFEIAQGRYLSAAVVAVGLSTA